MMAEENKEQQKEDHGAFYDGLSDVARADASANKFKGADSDKVFNMYREAQSMIGKDKIVRADPHNPDDVARWNRDIGVPETADEYRLDGADWAKDAGYDQEVMKSIALKAGLTPAQAKVVEQEYLNDIKSTMERDAKETEETNGKISQQLRQEMGAKFDESMARKDKFIDTFSRSPESAQALKALATSNPEVAASLADAAGVLSEHSLGGFTHTSFTLSPAEAAAKIEEIRGNPNHPYNKDEAGPAHSAAVDEVNRLQGHAMGLK
jgi:hypothetical protein